MTTVKPYAFKDPCTTGMAGNMVGSSSGATLPAPVTATDLLLRAAGRTDADAGGREAAETMGSAPLAGTAGLALIVLQDERILPVHE
jgi:hypothetical protein